MRSKRSRPRSAEGRPVSPLLCLIVLCAEFLPSSHREEEEEDDFDFEAAEPADDGTLDAIEVDAGAKGAKRFQARRRAAPRVVPPPSAVVAAALLQLGGLGAGAAGGLVLGNGG